MKQCISIALALFLAAAVSAETAYPVSVTTYDKDGKVITQVFKQAPKKVITNNLSMTEMLIELGLQDRIIGMLDPDNAVTGKYKKAIDSIPHIGNKKTVSREVVFSYEPDAVLGRNMMFSEKSLGTVSFWNENGIPIYAQKASVLNIKQDLQNIIEDVRNLGIIFNVQDKAEAYAKQLEQRLNAVLQHISTKGTSLKKALIMCAYNGTTFGAYKSALQESLLNVLGYTNIATGTSGLTTENLITMNPELIIYVTSDRNKKLDANAVSSLQANVVLVDVPAIAQRKIMTISYDELMDYGPAVLNALKLLMPSCGSSFNTKRDITNHISLSGIDITVSEPAEYNLQHRYPAVFVNDGQIEYLESLAPSIFLFGLHARSRFDDYTPWAAESFRTDCPPFGGKGAEYHHLLFKTLLPELKTKYPLDDSRLAYGGYSLGGLAAVWSLFEYTDIPYIFSLCGSFWYPGFPEYCREHKVLHSNAAVYLLNGKREGGKHGNRLENTPKYAAEVHQALRMQIAHTTVVFDPFGHHDKMFERFRAVQQWLTECWQL